MSTNVDTQHAVYRDMAPTIKLVRACIAGQKEVKALREDALPGFAVVDVERYNLFLERAILTNYTGRSSEGLRGGLKRKDPVIELPTQLEYLKDNADGAGTGLVEFKELVEQEVVETGECGVLTVRPAAEEGDTSEDEKIKGLRTKLALYPRESIINWEYKTINHLSVLSLLVLQESVNVENADEFKPDYKPFYRVFALDENGLCYQREFDHNKAQVGENVYINDDNGSPLTYIPFDPTGAQKNRLGANKPPLYDMTVVNIGHFRNSAEYEEALHMMNQPTLFIDVGEMSVSEWKEEYPNGMTIGSRHGNGLGKGGKPHLVYMQANGMANEGMARKEEQMLAIGAKIVESSIERTAEEAKINAGAENASLNTIADNVANMFIKALENAAAFEGANPDEITFIPNKEFFPETIDPQMIAQMIMLETNGTIAKKDTRAKLRKAELLAADRTDDDIQADLEEEGFYLNQDGGVDL